MRFYAGNAPRTAGRHVLELQWPLNRRCPPSAPIRAPRRDALSRLGISVKLQVAFGVVAGMTVIAAAVALLSFETVESGLQDVTARQVPVTLDAMRLSVISRDISATAARFISARTVADQRNALASIEEKRVDLATVLGRMKNTSGDSAALTSLRHPIATAGGQPRGARRGDHAAHRAAG